MFLVGRDNVADTATGYGLDGPGIESRWGVIYPCLNRPCAPPAFYTMGTGLFMGVKRPGHGVETHPI
jgi:hypothetical protein